MLFDHGADAVAAFFLALQTMKILNLSLSMQLFAIFIFIMNTYFCAMWSQYCIGYFRLGRINPVDEGLPIYAIMCLVATQVDLSMVSQHHIYGSYAEEIIYIMLILLVPTVYSLCKDIFRKSIVPWYVVAFMPLLYISAGLCCWGFYSSVPEITAEVFYPFYYCLMFMWSRNMILIQFQFIVKQKYRVFNIATVMLIASVAIFYFGKDYLPMSGCQYFIGWAVIQGVVFLEFCSSILSEGAVMLNIHVFKLGSRAKV